MTPEDKYDPKSAFKMFTAFPDTTIQMAIQEMKDEGLIVQDKMRYGRVPGRNINVSQK